MAWSFVAHRGSNNEKISDTLLTMSVNAVVATGQVVIVRCVTDPNPATPTGLSNDHSRVWTSDAGINRGEFTKIIEFTFAGNVTVSLWKRLVSTDILLTYFLRLELAVAVTAKVMAAEEFNYVAPGISGEQEPRIAGAIAMSGTSTTPSATLSPISGPLTGDGTYLFIGHVGIEGPNGDTYTQDTDYAPADGSPVGTTGGGAATNVASRWGQRVATLVADTYNPTLGTSRDWVCILAALEEQVSVGNSAQSPMENLGPVQSGRQVTDRFTRDNSDVVGPGWFEDEAADCGMFIDVSGGVVGQTLEVAPINARINVEGFARRTDRPLSSDQFNDLFVPFHIDLIGWPLDYRVGPGVRCSGTRGAFTGYAALFRGLSGSMDVQLRKFVGQSLAGGGTLLGTWVGDVFNSQFRIEAEGSTIRVKVNGVTQISVADAAVLYWGQPAVVVWGVGDGASLPIIDFNKFLGGDLVPEISAHEAIGFVMRSLAAPYESLTVVVAAAPTALEAAGFVARSLAGVLEALGYVPVERASPYEALTPVSRDGMTPFETLTVVLQSATAPYESLLGLVAVLQSAVTPFEALGFVVRFAITPQEAHGLPREFRPRGSTLQDLEIETKHWIRQRTWDIRRLRRRRTG